MRPQRHPEGFCSRPLLGLLVFAASLVHLSAVSIKVVRPEPGEVLSLATGSTFVIGTVDPAHSMVVCNGVECEVTDDGAFLGFVPIRLVPKWTDLRGQKCDAEFSFVVRHDGAEQRTVIPAVSSRSPSAVVLAREWFDPPRFGRLLRNQLVGLEGDRLGDVVFLPAGCVLESMEGNRTTHLCKTADGTEISVSTADMEEIRTLPDRQLLGQEVELAIRDQKTILSKRKIIGPWPADQVLWGIEMPGFRGRAQLRGDGKAVDREHPLQGVRVCLDPGHHPDRGAVGPRGFEERESNLLVARETAALLEAEGAQAGFARENDPLPIKERHPRFHALQPDLVVSIHNNSVGDGQDPRLVRGTQTFYLYPWSKPLAEAVHRAIIERLGTRDRGCIRRNLYVPRFPGCPSILIEPEYIILPDQEKKFQDPGYRRKLAEAIVAGIRSFLLEQAGN